MQISSAYSQCTRSSGGDIYYKDSQGNPIAKYLPGKTKGEPTKKWTETCAPKVSEMSDNEENKEGPSNQDCKRCAARYGGPQRTVVCVKQLRCSRAQMGAFDFFALEKPLVDSCGDVMVCSEETRLCEFLCPDEFTYSISSGLCERTCLSNETFDPETLTCNACPEGLLANSEKTECVCPEGLELNNGSCVEPAVVCSLSEIIVDNTCVACTLGREPDPTRTECICPVGQSFNGSLCVEDEVICLADQIKVDNSCQSCSGGQLPNLQSNTCECPIGETLRNGQCQASFPDELNLVIDNYSRTMVNQNIVDSYQHSFDTGLPDARSFRLSMVALDSVSCVQIVDGSQLTGLTTSYQSSVVYSSFPFPSNNPYIANGRVTIQNVLGAFTVTDSLTGQPRKTQQGDCIFSIAESRNLLQTEPLKLSVHKFIVP